MRLALASDHGGFRLKAFLAKALEGDGHQLLDVGTDSSASVDFPDFAPKIAEAVLSKRADLGVFLCGSGIGASISANKIPGIRAALCHDVYSARQSREHNDANVLCLGGRVVGEELALEIVKAWLAAGFLDEEKYRRRVEKIKALEPNG